MTLRSPFEIWEVKPCVVPMLSILILIATRPLMFQLEPTFLGCELTFYTMALLSAIHAYRQVRSHVPRHLRNLWLSVPFDDDTGGSLPLGLCDHRHARACH